MQIDRLTPAYKARRSPSMIGISVLIIFSAVAVAFWPGDQSGSYGAGTAALAQTHTGGHDEGDHTGGQGGGGHAGGQGGSGGHQGGGNPNPGPGPGSGSGQGTGQGQSGSTGTGGRPVWAREGIPAVELGRLNVARSPDQVLQRAFAEALASLSPDMAGFYSMNLNEMIVELSTNFDNLSYIDSPLQNLALFQDALDGASVLTSTGEIVNSTDTLMAAFLGIASDKTVPITSDTVTAVSTILGTPVTGAAAAALAADAEAVRIAVLAGHG